MISSFTFPAPEGLSEKEDAFRREKFHNRGAPMTISRRSFLAAHAAAAGALASPLVALVSGPPKKKAPDPPRTVKTGGAQAVPIDGGKYKVWVKKVGSGPIHVLTLHGGPGVTHEYFECFEEFLPRAGITFWYYDQLGSGFSDQ